MIRKVLVWVLLMCSGWILFGNTGMNTGNTGGTNNPNDQDDDNQSSIGTDNHDPYMDMELSHNNRYLLVSHSEDFSLYDVEDDKLLYRKPHAYHQVHDFIFSPDDTTFLISGEDKCELYDIATGRVVFQYPATDDVYALEYHPDGESIFIAQGSSIVQYPIKSLSQIRNFETGVWSKIKTIKLSGDGQFLIAGTGTTIFIFKIEEGRLIRKGNLDTGGIRNVEGFFVTGNPRYFLAWDKNAASTFDIQTGSVRRKFNNGIFREPSTGTLMDNGKAFLVCDTISCSMMNSESGSRMEYYSLGLRVKARSIQASYDNEKLYIHGEDYIYRYTFESETVEYLFPYKK